MGCLGYNFTVCLHFLFQISLANLEVCLKPDDDISNYEKDPICNKPEVSFNCGKEGGCQTEIITSAWKVKL